MVRDELAATKHHLRYLWKGHIIDGCEKTQMYNISLGKLVYHRNLMVAQLTRNIKTADELDMFTIVKKNFCLKGGSEK